MLKVIGHTSTLFSSVIREFLTTFYSMEYCEYNLLVIFRGECTKLPEEILEKIRTEIVEKIPASALRIYLEYTDVVDSVAKYKVWTFGEASKYLPMHLDMDPSRFHVWSAEFTRCALRADGPVDLVHVTGEE